MLLTTGTNYSRVRQQRCALHNTSQRHTRAPSRWQCTSYRLPGQTSEMPHSANTTTPTTDGSAPVGYQAYSTTVQHAKQYTPQDEFSTCLLYSRDRVQKRRASMKFCRRALSKAMLVVRKVIPGGVPMLHVIRSPLAHLYTGPTYLVTQPTTRQYQSSGW